MRKKVAGLITGVIVTASLLIFFLGPLSPTPAVGESNSSNTTEPVSDNATFRENIHSMLQDTGSKIRDEDISRFYQKLIEAYELDEASSGTPGDGDPSPADILPDMNKINHAALLLPLQEAGKNIQDKELARFYYKLLADVGWPIEPEE